MALRKGALQELVEKFTLLEQQVNHRLTEIEANSTWHTRLIAGVFLSILALFLLGVGNMVWGG